jgi:hypothetical protein
MLVPGNQPMNILIPFRKNYRGDINGDHRLSSLNTHMQARNKAINMAPKVVSNEPSAISAVGVEAKTITFSTVSLMCFMLIVSGSGGGHNPYCDHLLSTHSSRYTECVQTGVSVDAC